MKPEWQAFLKDAGAEFSSHKLSSFGNPRREQRIIDTGLIVSDLSYLGLISVNGDDALEFLQGQFTNDIRQVTEHHSQLSAYCTPKGRMLASFRIFQREHTYYLRLPTELLETTMARLRMYILRSKVTLKDATNALIGIGFSGPNADKRLAEILADPPTQADAVSHTQDYTILRTPGPHPRYEIYGHLEEMKSLWGKMDVHGAPVGSSTWSLLDIRAGIPVIYPETSEAFTPQMANLDLINGVSFQKGCYTGQEVVARTHYLGKPKRRMYRIRINSNQEVLPGTPLYCASSDSEQGAGSIVNAQINADDMTEALAVIQINDAQNGSLKLNDKTGPAITVLDLPYAIEDTGSGGNA